MDNSKDQVDNDDDRIDEVNDRFRKVKTIFLFTTFVGFVSISSIFQILSKPISSWGYCFDIALLDLVFARINMLLPPIFNSKYILQFYVSNVKPIKLKRLYVRFYQNRE